METLVAPCNNKILVPKHNHKPYPWPSKGPLAFKVLAFVTKWVYVWANNTKHLSSFLIIAQDF
jgi:hypothetical protein